MLLLSLALACGSPQERPLEESPREPAPVRLVVGAQELHDLWEAEPELGIVDVRDRAAYAAGHVPGAVNVPERVIIGHLDELEEWRHEPLYVYCVTSRSSRIIQKILTDFGFEEVVAVQGGWEAWREEGWPVTEGPGP